MLSVASFIWITLLAAPTPLELDRWRVINDTVMGGVSSSEIVEVTKGVLTFRGHLSLDNNGGFTSARATLAADWSGADHLRLRVIGDGRQYLATVRVRDARLRRIYYRAPFQTKAKGETEIVIPLADFQAYVFGRPVPQAPHLMGMLHGIGSVGLMLADKKPGAFSLQILELGPGQRGPKRTARIQYGSVISAPLERAIEEGVPLYNQGDAAGCHALYKGALERLVATAKAQLSPGHIDLLTGALARATQMKSADEQAWALRTAMDVILSHKGP